MCVRFRYDLTVRQLQLKLWSTRLEQHLLIMSKSKSSEVNILRNRKILYQNVINGILRKVIQWILWLYKMIHIFLYSFHKSENFFQWALNQWFAIFFSFKSQISSANWNCLREKRENFLNVKFIQRLHLWIRMNVKLLLIFNYY